MLPLAPHRTRTTTSSAKPHAKETARACIRPLPDLRATPGLLMLLIMNPLCMRTFTAPHIVPFNPLTQQAHDERVTRTICLGGRTEFVITLLRQQLRACSNQQARPSRHCHHSALRGARRA